MSRRLLRGDDPWEYPDREGVLDWAQNPYIKRVNTAFCLVADKVSEINDRLVKRALAMDGTCTGEHGVGYGKLEFLIAEHGEAVSVMRAIKQALDPDNILNPGKIVRV